MKIGIVTHHWGTNNYGQYLQHYAMQTYLRSLGHEPFLIDYVPPTQIAAVTDKIHKAFLMPWKIGPFLVNKLAEKYSAANENSRYSEFLKFRKEYFSLSEKYHSCADLQKNPPEADVYISGSDQVWNREGDEVPSPFFLDFGKDSIRRVSYAASWGRTSLSEKEKERLVPLLKCFQFVSVREKSGIELCKECGYPDAVVAPDPAFLLTPEHYRNIAVKPKNQTKKYILCYRLTDKDSLDFGKLKKWAEKQDMEIKYVTGNNLFEPFRKPIYPSIQEWLGLIDHAEYVVTDSFHASVFSCLFEKKFAVLSRHGIGSSMNTRLDYLFELLNTVPRYIEDNNFEIMRHPYSAKVVDIRNKARESLNEALKG